MDDADEARGLEEDHPTDGNAEDLVQCTCCLDKHSLIAFPKDKFGKRKGKMCNECVTGSESMQRLLRFAWQEDYKDRYAKFKGEKALWRKTTFGFKSNPESRKGKRVFQRSQASLENVKKKSKKMRRLKIKERLTLTAFKEHFEKKRKRRQNFKAMPRLMG